jgi:hypothetical protein
MLKPEFRVAGLKLLVVWEIGIYITAVTVWPLRPSSLLPADLDEAADISKLVGPAAAPQRKSHSTASAPAHVYDIR